MIAAPVRPLVAKCHSVTMTRVKVEQMMCWTLLFTVMGNMQICGNRGEEENGGYERAGCKKQKLFEPPQTSHNGASSKQRFELATSDKTTLHSALAGEQTNTAWLKLAIINL